MARRGRLEKETARGGEASRVRGLSALDSLPCAKQIVVELVFSTIGALISRKTVGSRFVTFTQLSLTVVSVIF